MSRSFLTKSDAQAWARQTEVDVDRRALKHNPKKLEKVTVGELVERYRQEVTPNKRGHEAESIILAAFSKRSLAAKKLSEVTSQDIAAFRDERLTEVKPGTVARQMATLHHVFEVARLEWNIPIEPNPLALVKRPEPSKPRERRLEDGEFERLIEACKACHNIHIEPIVRLAIETGMRRGEILNVHRKHLDLAARLLHIPITKNGHARTIPLTSEAVRIFESLKPKEHDGNDANDGKVFPISANAFRLAWERTKRRAGIEDLRFHDLRHEAVTRFFEMGLSAPEVALISGHRDHRVLMRYTHLKASHVLQKLLDDS